MAVRTREEILANNLLKAVTSAFVLLVLFFLSCESKIPVISSIEPKIGRMGEIVTLTGENFGASREESYVTIAGTPPTGSSYYLWQDNLIMVRIPEMGESGLVHVHSRGRKSNGVLFSNSASVPKLVEGEEFGLGPRIVSISPQAGAVGTTITVTGNNFGGSREGGGVFFSWDYSSLLNPYAVKKPEFIEVSETEFGYLSWNVREINVRIPDGAVSGNLEIRTPHGKSRPVSFNISGKPGKKNFTDKRNYTVNYSVDIKVLESTRPNSLYLWIPMPVNSPSQRNINLVSRNIEPFVENHKGVSLFKLDNMLTNANQSINLSFNVDVYAVETEINYQSVKNETSPLSAVYTQSSVFVQSDNPQVKEILNTIIGREQNPYLKARLIYNWIIANVQISETLSSSSDNIIPAIETKSADAYTAALLYTALARAAGIPCIPVSGVLIDRYGQTQRHYWAEFWISEFGWVPVDPAMGTGKVGASFVENENPSVYYFGNADNRRIAFSRGESVLSQIENRGRLVSHGQSYSIQNIWEEASGGLESYTSLWGDITIGGIYVQ
jgi:transglutaminase-like putative cysteine protease